MLKPRGPRGASGRHHEAFDSLPFRAIRAVVAWCVRWRRSVVALTVVALFFVRETKGAGLDEADVAGTPDAAPADVRA